jgi:tryptophan-rich sensory protein
MAKFDMSMLVIFVPYLMHALSYKACPMDRRAGESIKARPPGYVFAVLWNILYAMIGISWYITRSSDPNNLLGAKVSDWLFIANQVSINAWLYYYNCQHDKKMALYTYIPSIATTIALVLYNVMFQKQWWTYLLLIPYLVWLMFAQQLSLQEFEAEN